MSTPHHQDENIKHLERITDFLKSTTDMAKHVSTLAAGAIVLTATFLDKLRPAIYARKALPTAIVLLLASMIFALLYCSSALRTSGVIGEYIVALKSPDSGERLKDFEAFGVRLRRQVKYPDRLYPVALLCFTGGIIAVGVFAIRNLK